jgi:hypothetical protein
MTTAVLTNRFSPLATSIAGTALPTVARLWYLTAVVGQLAFAFTVSLGGLYMIWIRGSLADAEGDKAQAIANYKISLQLDPASRSAVQALEKLGAPSEPLSSK